MPGSNIQRANEKWQFGVRPMREVNWLSNDPAKKSCGSFPSVAPRRRGPSSREGLIASRNTFEQVQEIIVGNFDSDRFFSSVVREPLFNENCSDCFSNKSAPCGKLDIARTVVSNHTLSDEGGILAHIQMVCVRISRVNGTRVLHFCRSVSQKRLGLSAKRGGAEAFRWTKRVAPQF